MAKTDGGFKVFVRGLPRLGGLNEDARAEEIRQLRKMFFRDFASFGKFRVFIHPTKGFATLTFEDSKAGKEAAEIGKQEFFVDDLGKRKLTLYFREDRFNQTGASPNQAAPAAEEPKMADKKKDAHAEEKKDAPASEAPKQEKKDKEGSLGHEVKEAVLTGLGWEAGTWTIKNLFKQLLPTAAQKATEAAAKHLKGVMERKLKNTDDDFLRIFAAMETAPRLKLQRLLHALDQEATDSGPKSLLNPTPVGMGHAARSKFQDTFVDMITKDVPVNDKGLPELDEHIIAEAARILTDMVNSTDDVNEQIKLAQGLVDMTPATQRVKDFWAKFSDILEGAAANSELAAHATGFRTRMAARRARNRRLSW